MIVRTVFFRLAWTLAGLGLLFSAGPLAAQQEVPEVVRELLAEGDRHRAAGRFDQAVASYREARRLGPGVLEVFTPLGALHVARGELEVALEIFGAGLEIAPRDRQLLFNAAVMAMRLDRLDEALGLVERALEVRRNDAAAQSLHGAVLSRLDRPREALTALESAARIAPGDPQILFRLGNLHYQLQQREQAIEAFRKAIKKDRKLLRAHYNLGAVLVEMGRYDEALAAYRVALEPHEAAFAAGESVDASHARAYQNLGAIHFQREEWQQALDAYGKAVRLDPELTGALYNLGFIHFRLDQLDAAEKAYQSALALDPELPLAYLHLAQIHRRRGELEAAVRWLDEGLPRLKESAPRLEALRVLAQCQVSLGRIEESEKAYRALLEVAPEDLAARLELGRLLARTGRAEEARSELERVRRAAPENLDASLELAALARAEGRTDDLTALYEEVVRRAGGGQIWPVRLNLALVYLRQGALGNARGHLEALSRLKPPPGQPSNGYPGSGERKLIATLHGLLLALDGDLAGARKRLTAVSSRDAGFVAAADLLAVLEILQGSADSVSTESLTGSYSRLAGGTLGPMARANLGQALWLARRPGDARAHLEAAAEAFPQWLSVQAALGDIALGEKRYRDAIRQLTRAERLCGESISPLGSEIPDVFSATVGGSADGTGRLCERLARSLALARVGAALEDLVPALRGGRGLDGVRSLAARALAGELEAGPHAVALYVRGTALLGLGSDQAARRDLASAVAGELPEVLRAMAYNNLGVARLRLGKLEEAKAAFETARTGASPFAGATLNLGILLHDHAERPREALDRYREYLATSGRRRREVESWIERLEKIYR